MTNLLTLEMTQETLDSVTGGGVLVRRSGMTFSKINAPQQNNSTIVLKDASFNAPTRGSGNAGGLLINVTQTNQ